MKFQLEPYNRNVPDADLISDLLDVKTKLGNDKITRENYDRYGKYSPKLFVNRFGTWNKALAKAGISLNTQFDISDEELYKNIEDVWIKLGRQPKYTEFKQPLSKYSTKPYENRFGRWRKALEQFVEYINAEPNEILTKEIIEVGHDDYKKHETIHKTKREVSDRLRFRILMRDGFTCKKCGRSSLKERDVELHVDHILPWSKGGETLPENLETKCEKCNLGKGNAFDV